MLFAERDIEAGEEICISYTTFKDFAKNIPAHVSRNVLETKWGIVCKSDCVCYDVETQQILERSYELDSEIIQFGTINPDRSLAAVKELLENQEIIGSSFGGKARTLYDGFQVGIGREKTMDLAEKYIQEAYEISSSYRHPRCEEVLKFERWAKSKDFSTQFNYLRL